MRLWKWRPYSAETSLSRGYLSNTPFRASPNMDNTRQFVLALAVPTWTQWDHSAASQIQRPALMGVCVRWGTGAFVGSWMYIIRPEMTWKASPGEGPGTNSSSVGTSVWHSMASMQSLLAMRASVSTQRRKSACLLSCSWKRSKRSILRRFMGKRFSNTTSSSSICDWAISRSFTSCCTSVATPQLMLWSLRKRRSVRIF
mmetsp:Transcript_35341/g.110140  ORF Transcript_35341/g.110140 Transcript_35341/m.110140 type:complete len:200 (-) Transcript_35341:157-756(-)